MVHLAGASAFPVTEMNWEDVLSRRANLVMSATVAPPTSKRCPVCLKAFSETEQGPPYHWYRELPGRVRCHQWLTRAFCSAQCFRNCHFQEVTIPVDVLETSNDEAPAVTAPTKYSSQIDTPESVDVDLNIFKNLLAILHRKPQVGKYTSGSYKRVSPLIKASNILRAPPSSPKRHIILTTALPLRLLIL